MKKQRIYINQHVTMLEILLVVVIILMLVTLLTFGFRKGFVIAKDMQCRNNISEIMRATMTYTIDSDKVMPSAYNIEDNYSNSFYEYLSCGSAKIFKERYYRCPADGYTEEQGALIEQTEAYPRSYIYNTGLEGAFERGPMSFHRNSGNYRNYWVKTTFKNNPSKLAALMDGKCYNYPESTSSKNYGWSLYTKNTEEKTHMAFPHDGWMNVAYMDAHVSALSPVDGTFDGGLQLTSWDNWENKNKWWKWYPFSEYKAASALVSSNSSEKEHIDLRTPHGKAIGTYNWGSNSKNCIFFEKK
ncbi:MAG: type II secretion system protein [Verrucomicrobiota bacterium]|nr:type II secretion system protein [Verrucomicrobiota bacterium]